MPQKRYGMVIDLRHCIGCRYCMAACPYNLGFINPRYNIVEKCDFCQARIDQGIFPAGASD